MSDIIPDEMLRRDHKCWICGKPLRVLRARTCSEKCRAIKSRRLRGIQSREEYLYRKYINRREGVARSCRKV